jgi:hypothetical protein
MIKTIICQNKDCGLPVLRVHKTDRQDKFCSKECYGQYKREQANVPYPRIRVNGKRVYLHRYIYEQMTGETLKPSDIIHHKDENPYNRNFENLEKLTDQGEHLRRHNYHRGRRAAQTWQPDDEFSF